ncbi:hypothetical protein CISG_02456 [Coccidioides immitis RMSCC 3703]|uniref:Uncharacterized protein n=1 Tax=Coccidioides immitis RMSCC 3703 TaxID=454286 RepID=A0A0J8U337_COCIT|nr:hypothetical protein CISG_02456 [Coccidioides immitis RMSCC 3703]
MNERKIGPRENGGRRLWRSSKTELRGREEGVVPVTQAGFDDDDDDRAGFGNFREANSSDAAAAAATDAFNANGANSPLCSGFDDAPAHYSNDWARQDWGKVGKGYSIFCFCFFFFSSVSSSASLQQNPGRRRGGARQHPCQSQLTLGSAPRDPPLTRAQFLLSSPPGIVRNRAVLSDFSALQKKKRKKKKKP